MNSNQFLSQLLVSQNLSKQQIDILTSHREEIEKFLREEFGQEPVIRYAGSKAKGTMILESYDLDIVCYFPHGSNLTIKEIYNKVADVLGSKYYIERKTSAIRIKSLKEKADYHIDVVPGKFVSGSNGDAFLYISSGEQERLQTNIDTHIGYITKSGCQDVIKLMKLWKTRNKLSFKTFVLEIFTVETLKGTQDKNNFTAVMEKLFTALKNGIKATSLKDPANSNNTVSEILTDSDKDLLSRKASEVYSTLTRSGFDDVASWQNIFLEYGNDINKTPLAGTPFIGSKIPDKPWHT